MHPAVLLPQLADLGKELIRLMVQTREPSTQVDLTKRLSRTVSQATVSREMAKLIRAGLVIKDGVTKNAGFRLTDSARWWATPPGMRTPVNFDMGRIDRYVPNETRWLPDAHAERMRNASDTVAHRLDASTYSRQIAERFLIDLSWASSHLEGNTYDFLDTEILIKYGDPASGKDPRETTMILNHKQAISFMLDRFEQAPIEAKLMEQIHAFLMRDLLEAPNVGTIRTDGVRIGGTAYRPSNDRIALSRALADLTWKAGRVEDPYEAAFVLLIGLSYVQAFADGNKRMGRLSANLPLMKAGLPPLSFMSIDRRSYISGLLAFYELGETELFAEAVTSSYEATTPHYAAAVATQRIPRTVEIQQRKRINQEVAAYVAKVIEGRRPDLAEHVDASFMDLPATDAEVVRSAVRGAVENLSEGNAPLYGITSDDFDAYRDASAPAHVM